MIDFSREPPFPLPRSLNDLGVPRKSVSFPRILAFSHSLLGHTAFTAFIPQLIMIFWCQSLVNIRLPRDVGRTPGCLRPPNNLFAISQPSEEWLAIEHKNHIVINQRWPVRRSHALIGSASVAVALIWPGLEEHGLLSDRLVRPPTRLLNRQEVSESH